MRVLYLLGRFLDAFVSKDCTILPVPTMSRTGVNTHIKQNFPATFSKGMRILN